MPQDVFLFSDTIANNIAFGIDNFKEEDLIQAARDAAVHQNIIGFEQGYQTLIGERGITLSGGQKQRVSIARALIKSHKILILDDCLSAVDTRTEEEILNSLGRIMAGRTTIIIAHRVSTIKNADQILVMDEGRVVEKGNHEQLMKLNGDYCQLYQKQLLDEAE